MSRSVLHNWECAIEKLGGKNANALLDIAQDIYNTGYVRGKNYELSVIGDIKAEIEEEKEYAYADFDEYNNEILGFDDTDVCERDLCCIGLGRALQIINKHISGKESNNEVSN